MTDTAKASWITDHPFEPRVRPVAPLRAVRLNGLDVVFPPNPALCQYCRMAEAAHAETTAKQAIIQGNPLSLNREHGEPNEHTQERP